METDPNYYLSTKKKHLKFCNTLIKGGNKALCTYRDPAFAREFKKEVPKEFELLLPHLPYIGGMQPWTRQLILTTWFIAVFKWMKKQHEPIDKTWKLCSDMLETRLRNFPKIVRRIIRYSIFSKKLKHTFKLQAKDSQQRKYAEGDVFYYTDTPNGFDYSMEIAQCAKMIFAQKVGALEFMPYICLVDKLWAEVFEYGLERKGTLSEGFKFCDFSLIKHGSVNVYSTVWKKEWEKP